MWWHIPILSELRKLKQEDYGSKAHLSQTDKTVSKERRKKESRNSALRKQAEEECLPSQLVPSTVTDWKEGGRRRKRGDERGLKKNHRKRESRRGCSHSPGQTAERARSKMCFTPLTLQFGAPSRLEVKLSNSTRMRCFSSSFTGEDTEPSSTASTDFAKKPLRTS